LGGAHLPVTLPLLTHDQLPYVADGPSVYCLYAALPGRPYDDFAARQGLHNATTLGAALGQLHLALTQCESVEGFATFGDPVSDLVAALRAERSVTGDVEPLGTIAATLRPVDTLPETVIHRDPHPGNLLFEDGHLSGILDFDLMMRGPRIFDPCYCGTSMLLAQFADERHRGYWLDLVQALLAGYRRLVPLTAAEQAGLFTMLAVIELLFIVNALRTHRPDAASMNQRALLWLHHHRRHIEKAIAV